LSFPPNNKVCDNAAEAQSMKEAKEVLKTAKEDKLIEELAS